VTYDKDSKHAQELGRVVLPIVKKALGAKRIISCELDNATIVSLFDRYAGVDAVTVDKHGVRGIALRIQRQKHARWESFTIRCSRRSGVATELQKRLHNIEHGYIYPYLTCQFYCDVNGNIIYGSIIRTTDLYEYVRNKLVFLCDHQYRQASEGEGFIYILFDQLQNYGGYKMLRW